MSVQYFRIISGVRIPLSVVYLAATLFCDGGLVLAIQVFMGRYSSRYVIISVIDISIGYGG
jgi:hypothetical protein